MLHDFIRNLLEARSYVQGGCGKMILLVDKIEFIDSVKNSGRILKLMIPLSSSSEFVKKVPALIYLIQSFLLVFLV